MTKGTLHFRRVHEGIYAHCHFLYDCCIADLLKILVRSRAIARYQERALLHHNALLQPLPTLRITIVIRATRHASFVLAQANVVNVLVGGI